MSSPDLAHENHTSSEVWCYATTHGEDGNDPWFAVFRLMTKEDLHRAAGIGYFKKQHIQKTGWYPNMDGL